jgi:hypothetical protein
LTPPAALAELLGRVEACTGPDRELDGHIYGALGFQIIQRFGDFEWRPDGKGIWKTMPSPTASFDAALALCERVLPGWTIANINQDDTKRWWSELREGYQTSYNRVVFSGPLATPALALVTAMIKALTSPEDDDDLGYHGPKDRDRM